MRLYRQHHLMHETLEYGYSLQSEAYPDLGQRCYVDPTALEALDRLVEGPVTGFSDLIAAERALRALVFHDAIEVLRPCIRVQVINPDTPNALVLNPAEPSAKIPAIEEFLQMVDRHEHICPIEQLIGFNDPEIEQRFVEQQRQRRQHYFAKQPRAQDGGIDLINSDRVELEYIADGPDVYFSREFPSNEDLIRRFIRPIPETNLLSYFGRGAVRDRYEAALGGLQRYKDAPFFDALDESWRDVAKRAAFSVGVPLPWLSTIILSRAVSRENIPNTILEFREEFQEPRRQLWSLIEEGGWRTAGPAALQEIDRLDQAAREVVPKELRYEPGRIGLAIKVLGRVGLFDWTGLGSTALELLEKLSSSPIHQVDAAKVLRSELRDADLQFAVRKHLTEEEIKHIGRP